MSIIELMDTDDYVSNEPVSYIYPPTQPGYQLGAEIFQRSIFFELRAVDGEADEWDRVGEVVVDCDWSVEPTMFPTWAAETIREFKAAIPKVGPEIVGYTHGREKMIFLRQDELDDLASGSGLDHDTIYITANGVYGDALAERIISHNIRQRENSLA